MGHVFRTSLKMLFIVRSYAYYSARKKSLLQSTGGIKGKRKRNIKSPAGPGRACCIRMDSEDLQLGISVAVADGVDLDMVFAHRAYICPVSLVIRNVRDGEEGIDGPVEDLGRR